MKAGLDLRGIRAGFGPVEVLHGVDLSVPAGSIVALLGQNGAGTSTLLRCAAGLVPIRAGSIRLDGRDLSGLTPYRRARAGLVFVSDEHNVFSSLTVRENLQLFGRPGPEQLTIERACAVFPALSGLLGQRAGVLSGGERQMLALARTVLRPWSTLLLDEASRGLAADVAGRFFDHLASMRSPSRTIVVCEQFVDSALAVADLAYVMRRGRISFAGEPSELVGGALAASLH